jgi:UDP-N-acetylmuramoylalanine--D-glutamate ligase
VKELKSDIKEIHSRVTTSNREIVDKIDDMQTRIEHKMNANAQISQNQHEEIRKDVVRESLMDFENIEHRLEFVAKVHGIEFINDSKATNVNSTWYALESYSNPVVWIAGGVDKGNDYTMLNELVKARVKAIVCLGTDNSKLIAAFKEFLRAISALSASVAHPTKNIEVATKIALLTFENML